MCVCVCACVCVCVCVCASGIHPHPRVRAHLRIIHALLDLWSCVHQLNGKLYSHQLTHLMYKQLIHLYSPKVRPLSWLQTEDRVLSVQGGTVLVLDVQTAQNRDVCRGGGGE